MIARTSQSPIAARILIWFLLLAHAIPAQSMVSPDRVSYPLGIRLHSLSTSSQVFSNVLVYSRDPQNVFFEHANGLGSAKISELDRSTLRSLGVTVDFESDTLASFRWAAIRPSTWLPASGDVSALGLASLAVILILLVGLYLYSSFLFWMICVKVGAEPGIAVWLPVVQVLPVLRAARMSVVGPVFLLLLLIGSVLLRPHIGAYASTLAWVSGVATFACFLTWSFKICRVRGKSPYLAALLAVPGLNFFALLYLAGSK